ncbi:MAG TPA: DUF222 domain-containing protein [Ornithinimicrobium sp.]|nr:DUF222 domain-containing protein [Ornithinimicrobium sp.]
MTVRAIRPPAVLGAVEGARELVASGASVPVGSLGDEEIGEAIAGLARLESQAAAWRLALTAEADRRSLADRDAATGTDAWVAQLTGDTRTAAAGGVRLARLLREKYDATRAAFAAGELRVPQVRVILNAAEQAPPEATPDQVAAAEEWLVAKATGAGNRGGRPMDARRLRQTARRMFAHLDPDLAARHEAIMLGREHRHAEAETYLMLSDNGDGTWSGRFTIPELHGHLLNAALDRLTAPRRLCRDHDGNPVVDESVQAGLSHGHNYHELRGQAWCELLEHLPAHGHAANGVELIITTPLETLLDGLGTGRLDTRSPHARPRRRASAWAEPDAPPAVVGPGNREARTERSGR